MLHVYRGVPPNTSKLEISEAMERTVLCTLPSTFPQAMIGQKRVSESRASCTRTSPTKKRKLLRHCEEETFARTNRVTDGYNANSSDGNLPVLSLHSKHSSQAVILKSKRTKNARLPASFPCPPEHVPSQSLKQPEKEKNEPYGEMMTSSPVIIEGTIPDVLQWVRGIMDRHVRAIGCPQRLQSDKRGTIVKEIRDFVSCRIREYRYLSIKQKKGRGLWGGNSRFWENVVVFTMKLPADGNAANILEAMRRYPSSELVHDGLRLLFGKEKVLGQVGFKIPSGCNSIAAYDYYGHTINTCNRWFERDAYGRMQEMTIHMIASAEYIMRCAYRSRKSTTDVASRCCRFLQFMRERIIQEPDAGVNVIKLVSADILDEMPADTACLCLKQALLIGHTAIVDGAKAVGRRYCGRKTKSQGGHRVSLQMLQRIPPEVMDALVIRLSAAIREVVGKDVDFDEFELEMTRLLRKVDALFEETGTMFFGSIMKTAKPDAVPKKAEALFSSKPYKCNALRYETRHSA